MPNIPQWLIACLNGLAGCPPGPRPQLPNRRPCLLGQTLPRLMPLQQGIAPRRTERLLVPLLSLRGLQIAIPPIRRPAGFLPADFPLSRLRDRGRGEGSPQHRLQPQHLRPVIVQPCRPALRRLPNRLVLRLVTGICLITQDLLLQPFVGELLFCAVWPRHFVGCWFRIARFRPSGVDRTAQAYRRRRASRLRPLLFCQNPSRRLRHAAWRVGGGIVDGGWLGNVALLLCCIGLVIGFPAPGDMRQAAANAARQHHRQHATQCRPGHFAVALRHALRVELQVRLHSAWCGVFVLYRPLANVGNHFLGRFGCRHDPGLL